MEYITRYEKSKHGIWRPLVSVCLIGENGNSCNFEMLIDSGADRSVINLSTGRFLGFSIVNSDIIKQVTGIGGSQTTVNRKLQMGIFDKTIETVASWILSDKVPLLIGRDVFDYFHITFKQDEKVTVFKWLSK